MSEKYVEMRLRFTIDEYDLDGLAAALRRKGGDRAHLTLIHGQELEVKIDSVLVDGNLMFEEH